MPHLIPHVSPQVAALLKPATGPQEAFALTHQDKYQGDTDARGRPHGRGRMLYGSGESYDGQWRYGKRHGQGSYSNPDGFRYEGQWLDNKADGLGWARLAVGGEYEGEWRANRRHGWGLLRAATGEIYEGQWEDDHVHGMGRFTMPDGSYYEGRYERGARVEGTAVSADGSTTYTGSFRAKARHGKGTLVVAGKFRYRGDFTEDTQSGEGECQYTDGSAYSGQWKDGRWHGQGEWRERGGVAATVGGGSGSGGNEGAWYRGEFVNGVRHGKGTARDTQGNLYTGEWRDGVRHGTGTCSYACGDKYVGEWAAGLRHGRGTCVYASGDKYQGVWVSDQRHGYGAAVFADGVRFRGRWEEDCWVQSTADPAACRVSGPGLSRAVAGETARLVIEARDDLGNRRLSGGDAFRLELRLPSPAALARLGLGPVHGNGSAGVSSEQNGPGTEAQHGSPSPQAGVQAEKAEAAGVLVALGEVYDRDDGMYDVMYTCTTAGILELHVLLLEGQEDAGVPEPRSRHVGDSPYIIRVAGGPPTARTSRVVGAGARAVAAGQAAGFSVEPRDVWGNRVDRKHLPGGLPLQVELSNGVLDVPLEVQLAGSGLAEYRVSYTAPAVPGLYRLQVVAASTGRHVGGSPFSVRVDPTPVGDGDATSGDKASSGVSAAAAPSAPAVTDIVGAWARRAEAALRDAEASEVAAEPASAKTADARRATNPASSPVAAAVEAAAVPAEPGMQAVALTEADADAGARPAGAGALRATPGLSATAMAPRNQAATAAGAAVAAVSDAAAAAGISESEREYIMAHSEVPCVEDLRDLWKIHQLQEERKARDFLAFLASAPNGHANGTPA